jgi:transcriptional regulator with XRE-family HTH domain
MPGYSPNPDPGKRLREARQRLRLSTRDVERLSRRLAEERKNQEYYISHAWLSEMERGELTPGIFKIHTLSIIYQYRLHEVLAFFGVEIGDIGLEQIRLPLPHTHLVGIPDAPPEIALANMPGVQLEKTDLVSRMFSGFRGLEADLFPQGHTGPAVYGYVGTKDFTLSPLIRPGSFVQIDSSQRKIESSGWSGIFERPVYFVELREEYACSWCEEREGSLLAPTLSGVADPGQGGSISLPGGDHWPGDRSDDAHRSAARKTYRAYRSLLKPLVHGVSHLLRGFAA